MLLELNSSARATRVLKAQERYIKAKFGKVSAQDANYGWGQGREHMETKVYLHGVLISHLVKEKGKTRVTHYMRPFLLPILMAKQSLTKHKVTQ